MLAIQVLLCVLAIVSANPVVLKRRLTAKSSEDCPPTAPTIVPAPTTMISPATDPTTPAPTLPPSGYVIIAAVTGTFTRGGHLTGSFLPTEFNYEEEQLTVTGVLTAVLTRTRLGRTPATVGNVQQVVTLPVVLPNVNGGASNPGLGGILGRRLLQLTSPVSTSGSNSTNNSTTNNSTITNNSTSSPTTGGSSGSSSGGPCKVLHLNLAGPTDLTLLGLLVHLNPVELDVTAQPGGGLLGNLLCSISGLLNDLPLNLGDLGSLTGGLGQFSSLLNSVLDVLNLGNLPTQNLGGLDQVTGLLSSVVGILNLIQG